MTKLAHVLITPETCRHDEDRPCDVCDGGLAICARCGKAEIELDGDCLPPVGRALKCLLCAHVRPWGVYGSETGAAVCMTCQRQSLGDEEWRKEMILVLDELAGYATNKAPHLRVRRLREAFEQLNEQQRQYEEREAAVCPEDVSFEEYIHSLEKRLKNHE